MPLDSYPSWIQFADEWDFTPFFPGKKQVEFLPHAGAAEYALCAGPFPEYRCDVGFALSFASNGCTPGGFSPGKSQKDNTHDWDHMLMWRVEYQAYVKNAQMCD